MTYLPFLVILGVGTLFIGGAILFGVCLPQWINSRRMPAREMSADAETTGRFNRVDLDE